MPTLTTVTRPVPKRLCSLSLQRLDTMVPPAIIMLTMPAYATGTPIAGHTNFSFFGGYFSFAAQAQRAPRAAFPPPVADPQPFSGAGCHDKA